ncbi:MAG: NFACT family protein, partial [Nitrospinota bacterium]
MDSFFLRAITNELQEVLKGARISKISQPKKEVLLLELSALTGGTKRLLISCEAGYPRLHLTGSSFPSLPTPPAFCSSLRKHLLGSRISSLSQKGLERVVEIAAEKRDSMGRVRRYSLMCEVMGRWSNLILVESRTGLILDALKLFGRSKSRERPIIRNLPYKLPPTQGRLNPLATEREAFEKGLRLKRASPSPERMKSRLLALFEGLSPGAAKAIVDRVPENSRWGSLWEAFRQTMEEFREGRFEPHILLDEEGVDYLQISALAAPGVAPECLLPFESANEAAETFYKGVEEREAMRAVRESLMGVLSRALRKKNRILKLLARDLKVSERAEEFRERGELLLAHLKGLPRGMEEVRLKADGREVVIALDPRLDGLANAQKYFKRYKKLKRLKSFGERRQKAIESEVAYLQGVELALRDAARVEDMEEIARELEEAGYIKKEGKKR